MDEVVCWEGTDVLMSRVVFMHCADASNSIVYNTVDIFNATSGTWSTAALSVARTWPVATSLPNYGLALFAGGQSGTRCACAAAADS